MSRGRVGWLDCSAGVAGDMLLGALHDLGALADLPQVVASLPGLRADVTFAEVRRQGLRAVQATVTARDPDPPQRRLADVADLVTGADVADTVKDRAIATFRRLAVAEASVHGVDVEDVHFHEVGAVDAIVDVLGCCLGFQALGLDRLAASEIRLGGGSVNSGHGKIPIPSPAVLLLLAESDLLARFGGDVELATPTGVALVAQWADTTAAEIPPLSVRSVGVGAGARDRPGRANVVRLVVGETAAERDESWHVLEANVDDFDPRLWPGVLAALMDAGAADAWLTPILMKKGRPAHVLSALASDAVYRAVADAMFRSTSTIGLRRHSVAKQALRRESQSVEVAGHAVRVKVSYAGERAVTATPEWSDVEAVAAATGQPTKRILSLANAAATQLVDGT